MRRALLVALGATVLACDPSPAGSTGGATSAGSSPPLTASSGPRPAPPRYDDTKLHVPADFEGSAESAITKDNYKEALAELHEQITGEAPQDGADDHQDDAQGVSTATPEAPSPAPPASPAPAGAQPPTTQPPTTQPPPPAPAPPAPAPPAGENDPPEP